MGVNLAYRWFLPLGNVRPDELMLLCVLGVTDAGGQDGFQTGWTALCDVLDLWIGTEPRRRPFSNRLGIDAVAGGRGRRREEFAP